MGSNWAIVVATFNRPAYLDELLKSIRNSNLLPNQIVICSSGEDIFEIIQRNMDLAITHIYSKIANQSLQKKLAISNLKKDLDWVVFLDDDVLVKKNSFENIFNFIDSIPTEFKLRSLGIGFNIPNLSKIVNINKFKRMIARFFYLDSNKFGKVLKSGHANSYLRSKIAIQSEWLNGISIWKREVVDSYGNYLLLSKYSAYEDVIFSYNMSKTGFLWYCPTAQVVFQEDAITDYSNFDTQYISMIWKYYFVCSNKELSKLALLWSQIGRSLFYLTQKGTLKIKIKNILLPAILLNVIFMKKDPKIILQKSFGINEKL